MATTEWTSGVISAAGTELHFKRAGKGPPVLVLHRDIGTPDRLDFYDLLARDHDVIIPHHPGYGASPRADWVRGVRDIVAVYRTFQGKLGLQAATLVGLGFGGWIAAEIATVAPVDTPRLVLVGAMGLKPPQGEILDQALISYIEYVRAGFHAEDGFERIFGAQPSLAQLVQWDLCREMSFRVAWKPYMYSDSLPYLLRDVQSRALIVCGDNDRIVPPSAAMLYAESLPHARRETIEAAGHLVEMEQPERLADLIKRFAAGS